MADYYSILKKTISGLGKNTPEIRAAVYAKARVAIEKQLRGLDPQPSEEMIATQLASLEQAIAVIDQEYDVEQEPQPQESSSSVSTPVESMEAPVDRSPAALINRAAAAHADANSENEQKPEPVSTRQLEETNSGSSPFQPERAPEPVSGPEPTSEPSPSFAQAVAQAEPEAPSARSSLPELERAGRVARNRSQETSAEANPVRANLRPAHQTTAGALDAMSDAVRTNRSSRAGDERLVPAGPDPRAPELSVEKPKRSIGRIAFPLILLLILCGVGYAAWVNQDALFGTSDPLVAEVTQVDDTPSVEMPDEKTVEKEPVRIGDDGQDTSAEPVNEELTSGEQTDIAVTQDSPNSDAATASSEPENQETIEQAAVVPAGEGQENQPSEETQTVTPLIEPEQQPDAAENQQPVVEPVEENVEQAAVEPAIAPIGEIAYLYEEGSAGSGATRTNAGVSWAIQRQQIEQGSTPEPVIIGKMEVPEKGLSVDIAIKRNVDEALSASHLIELRFNTPDGFAGQGIDEIARFVMKATEEARGEALVAVPVKVSEGFFLIALDNLPQAVEVNTQLLASSSWIDVPLSYATGKRALLTLEKGNSGAAAFEQAFNDWRSR